MNIGWPTGSTRPPIIKHMAQIREIPIQADQAQVNLLKKMT